MLIAQDMKLCCASLAPAKCSPSRHYSFPQYHCDAIASMNATVRLYPKRKVLAAFEESPKAMQTFCGTLAHLVMMLRTNATSDLHATECGIFSH